MTNEELHSRIEEVVTEVEEMKGTCLSSFSELEARIEALEAHTALAQPGMEGEKTKDVAVEKRLLESLTKQQETFSGWIYLGKVRNGSSLLQDKSILTNSIPEGGGRQTVKMTTSLNLRNTPPTARGLGAINGVIARGLVVRVDEVQQNSIDSSYSAIWARVTAPKVSK